MASHGVHHIDLMQLMLGMPESVYAVIRNVGHDNSECKDLPDFERKGHPAQLLNFLRAIRGEEALFVDGAEGRKTIELITAIYKSATVSTAIAAAPSGGQP